MTSPASSIDDRTSTSHRHTTRIAHARSRHLAEHTGPMPKIPRAGRHHVTSETPHYFEARRIVAKYAQVTEAAGQA